MISRHLARRLLAALEDAPVVLLHGARQTGKTTLARWIAGTKRPSRYLTFDDATVLASAHADPSGFVAALDGPVVLDEVQRALPLFPAIKVAVDRDRRPGRFLLTGSAQVLLVPKLSESLAGRMQVLTLWPFSQGEIEGAVEGFLDAVFARALPSLSGRGEGRAGLIARALRGGFPEAHGRPDERRGEWLGSYLTTILQRDVRDLARIEGLSEMPRLLALVAARATSTLNASDLSRNANLPLTTLKRYLALLEATFLVRSIPAWSANLTMRLVKSPKLVLTDTGLLAHLTGLAPERLALDPGAAGPLLENFVMMELIKQATWSRSRFSLFHFRTAKGREVDVVVEHPDGRVVGIEIKAAVSVGSDDFKGLRALREVSGRRFHRGVVLYTGPEALPFGAGLHALPLDAVWRLGG
jgi:predicted AAA+ superfamily ATPase